MNLIRKLPYAWSRINGVMALVLPLLIWLESIEKLMKILFISVILPIIFLRGNQREIIFLKFFTIFMITIYFPINPNLKLILAVMISFLTDRGSFKFDPKVYLNYLRIALIFASSLNLVFEFIKNNVNYGLQFITFGYDNAFHLSLMRQFDLVGNFFYPVSDSGWSDFGLFRSYPAGQAAMYSQIGKILFIPPNDWRGSVSVFLTLNILVFLGILIASMNILTSSNRLSFKVSCFAGLITALGVVAYPGTLVVNGFPPYVLGLLILLIYLSGSNHSQNLTTLSQKLSFSIFLLTLICPSGLLFLILPAGVLIRKMLREFLSSQDSTSNLSPVILIVIFSLFSVWNLAMTSSKLGWRQIYAGGGVQPPNLFSSIFLLVISVLSFFVVVQSHRESLLLQTYASGFLGLVVLSLVTIYFTGSIQYYAIKHFYTFAFICVLLICIAHMRVQQKGISLPDFGVLVAICLSLAVTVTTPKIYTGGFMGIPIPAIKEVSQISLWENQVVDAEVLIDIADDPDTKTFDCVILVSRNKESDLNSRWINAMMGKGLVTETCFSGYWNSNSLNMVELVSRLRKLQMSFLLVIVNGSTFPDQQIENVKIKNFSKL